MDDDEISSNIARIEENDPRMKIRWNVVLGISFSKKMRDVIFRNEEYLGHDKTYAEMHDFVFDQLDKWSEDDDAEIIPARVKGNDVMTTKAHAKRNFDMTFSSVFSSLTSYIHLQRRDKEE